MWKRIVAASLAVACACGKSKSDNPQPQQPPPAPVGSNKEPPKAQPPAPGKPAMRGVNPKELDTSVVPGDDFYGYANGSWIKATQIPPDRSSYGTGAIVSETTLVRNREIIEGAAKAQPGSEARKMGDYYTAFMDEEGIQKRGGAPLVPILEKIGKIADATELARAIGESLRVDVDAINATHLHTDNLFGLWIAQDFDDPTRYSVFVMQGGLAMPDRSNYIEDPRHLPAYEKYVAGMLELAGMTDAPAKAKRIVELETKIAKAHATREATKSVKDGNNHWAAKDLPAKAPGVDWAALLTAAGLEKETQLVVWHPSAMTGIAALVKSEPLATWKDYLAYHAINEAAPYLSKQFVEAHFAFMGTTLLGTPKLQPRWKRGIEQVNAAMSHAVGKLYVQKYFPPAEKARAEAMVKNELAAFSKRIDGLTWMTAATRSKAKAKLAVLKVGIGYPDKWRDYSALEVAVDDPLGNARRASALATKQQLAKLGTPVDRSEWVMEPQLVNAVNLPAMNAMNFPAAILQPPYFDPTRPIAMDYGSIGAVIGHEISHSFDDQGAMFDATGRLANWWAPEDFQQFEASGKRLVAQYDAYKPLPDMAINGKLTLGENIADVAGLAVAYDALQIAGGGAAVDGFTPDQMFFISFAQTWRAMYREPALRNRLRTDGHSPGAWRALTARNLDAWYTAFDVKPTAKLFLAPADRVRVW